MNASEFYSVLKGFISLDIVLQAKQQADMSVLLNIATADGRSQLVVVFLNDDGDKVVAWSNIGSAPKDSVVLRSLLQENMDGSYSRLAILNDALVQVYRYPLEELEPKEFLLAVLEVASFADHYERKYYGGVDNG